MPERIFSVDDMLILKSPHVDFETEVIFRGYVDHDTKGMVYNPKAGSRFFVPVDWLRKKDAIPDGPTQTLRKKGN